MYADINTPKHYNYQVFEEGVHNPLDLVVAVDTDEGYVLFYRMMPKLKRIETVQLPNGDIVPRVFIRFGKFRLEDRG